MKKKKKKIIDNKNTGYFDFINDSWDSNYKIYRYNIGDLKIGFDIFSDLKDKSDYEEDFAYFLGTEFKISDNTIDYGSLKYLDNSYSTFKFIDSEDSEIITRGFNVLKEFKINKYITLKLIEDEILNEIYTRIFLNDQIFLQCAYILIQSPHKHELQSEIGSIDEAAERLDSSLEMPFENDSLIPPETIFWGHCSNIQAWCEFNYDSRILHSNLSFPLLRELYKLGDLQAKKVFKEEIAMRLLSQYAPVIKYLITERYLNYFNEEELELIFFKLNEQLNLPNSRLIDKSLVEALEYYSEFIPEDNSSIKDFVLNFGKKIRELIDS